MTSWQLVIFDLIMAGLFTLVLVGFTHVLPAPKNPVKRRSTRYIRLFLLTAFAAYASTTVRLFSDIPASILMEGALFLLAVYLLYFALCHRYGIAVGANHWRWCILHLVLFTLSQLCLIYIIDSALLRGVNIGLQSIVPISLSATTIIQNRRNTGDRLLLMAFLGGVMAIFIITAFHQWVFGGTAVALIKLSQVTFITLVLAAFCGFVLSIIYSLLDRIHQDMQTDPLTRARNRHYLDNAELNQWLLEPSTPPHSLILCDIDRFKQVNDTYGHAIGDRALKHFTHVILDNSRGKDVFIRMGGEEFLLILPNTEVRQSYTIAERMRKDIANRPLTLSDGTTVSLTCSFGVTVIDPTLTLETNIRHADIALYQAKSEGRNRSCKN